MTFHRVVSHSVLASAVCGVLLACNPKVRPFDVALSSGGAGGVTGSGGKLEDGGNSDAASGGGGSGGAGGSGGTAGDGGVAQVCTPMQPACDGDRATTCSDDGTAYLPGGEPCGNGRTCKQGMCEVDPCTPNTDFCLVNDIHTCAGDGQSSTLKQACNGNEFCDATDVQCKPQVCTPQTRQCGSGEQPEVCADDGSGWQADGAACGGTTPLCQGDGQCVCLTGTKQCGGSGGTQPQVCNDSNAWIGDGEPCSSAVYAGCSEGRCITRSIQVPFAEDWYRNWEGTSMHHTYIDNFRLDKYEVTVGQFRRFVEAVLQGWLPMNGSGKHSNLNAGNGLANSGTEGGNERGWDTAWNDRLPNVRKSWDDNLTMTGNPWTVSPYATWTPIVGANENKPINMINWYEAYAYCIWDGGFLPSEAEWEWAARGGDEARLYPWGGTDPGDTPAYAVYNCNFPADALGTCTGFRNIADVDEDPAVAGEAKWGHAHMAGNVWEWVLDWHTGYPPYPVECTNCANTDPDAVERVHRGGDFFWYKDDLYTYSHRIYQADWRDHFGGVRCARSP